MTLDDLPRTPQSARCFVGNESVEELHCRKFGNVGDVMVARLAVPNRGTEKLAPDQGCSGLT